MSNTKSDHFITTDYHMHTPFSSDGHDTPAAMCQQALALGLSEIATTEHAEWHPVMPHKGFQRVEAYFEAIEACRAQFGPQGLMLHAGVELGNPHVYSDEALTLLAGYPFDVVLASLHWLHGENIHEARCFAGREAEAVYADYFVELGRMVMNFDFDIVAHFDRILWRGTLLGATFDPLRLEPVIRETMATIVRYGRILELNTTFLDHKPHWREALVTMLRWFREEGGTRLVVNSDAHRANEIGRHRALAQTLLIEAGFELPTHLARVESNLNEIHF